MWTCEPDATSVRPFRGTKAGLAAVKLCLRQSSLSALTAYERYTIAAKPTIGPRFILSCYWSRGALSKSDGDGSGSGSGNTQILIEST